MGLWWLFRSIGNECRGWRKFNKATGVWPICSILVDILGTPLLFLGGTSCVLVTVGMQKSWFVYLALFCMVLGAAAAWYGLRRLAIKADVTRGHRSSAGPCSPKTLEEFLR
jgi:hypothetical protein